MLRTRLTLKPGQRGTHNLLAEYGNRLLCVRYRYDDEARLRYKTVELIVEEAPWSPPRQPTPRNVVDLRLRPDEHTLRRAVRLLGAIPNRPTRTWRTTYAVATILGLTARARIHL